jgi:hypothetical protein
MKEFFDNTEILLCECGSCEHQIIIHKDTDEIKTVVLRTHLVTYKNIFKRSWVAIKYIFGYKSKYGHWDSMIITKNNYQPLKDAINFIDEKK